MKLNWFKRIGIFYVPKSFIGWLLLLAGAAFAVYMFIKIDSTSHSASDTLRNFFLWCLIIGAIYTLIAFLTSRDNGNKANIN